MPPLKTQDTTPGKRYWRSLDDLADAPEFLDLVRREFPAFVDEMTKPASRRAFLKLMGASMALAGMTACRWPSEEILPFAHRPAGYLPGVPRHYATAMEVEGVATGVVVTSYDGRPVKIEGNPLHPGSRGGTSAFAQASLLELYDPDRSRRPARFVDGSAQEESWEAFDRFLRAHREKLRVQGGRGFRVLAESSASPSLRGQRERWQREYPAARWHEWEPMTRDEARVGSELVFGRAHRTHLALDRARVIVSVDDDFLYHHPAAVQYAADFAGGRDPEHGNVSRLWMFETSHSVTGGVADHRTALPARMIPVLTACLAAELFLEQGLELPPDTPGLRRVLERYQFHPLYTEMRFEFARDLIANRGASLVTVGPGQPREVHALAHLMNHALGNVGRTVFYTEEPDGTRDPHSRSLRALVDEMTAGEVDTLLILGGNPVFDAPPELEFEQRLAAVDTSVHVAAYRDETSLGCSWHVPRAHYLESWGDTRAWDGTYSVVQPLIEPLFGARSCLEVLAGTMGSEPARGHDLVRDTFRKKHGGADARWRRALHDGVLPDTAWPRTEPAPAAESWADLLKPHMRTRAERPEGGVELVFQRASGIGDGRWANNGWLQELPDPMTKLTWDNAALVSPATADRLGVEQGEMLAVRTSAGRIDLPVCVLPGQASDTVSVSVGYGRRSAGSVGNGVGFDVYRLRTLLSLHATLAEVDKTGGRYTLATTQEHFAIDALGAHERAERARDLVREIDLEDWLEDPEHALHRGHAPEPVELWKGVEYDGHKWGMAIDLNSCTGCNACVVACQAENNIPVVGKDEVAMGREMHWLRLDRYFAGDPEEPAAVHQPVTCHHCENAPCEQVCPVAATVHDHEGLNLMVYNRCVGTRYCANNCPFKVRRFNYFNNQKHDDQRDASIADMVHNPEVTVRSRGVMEKCTFCVQRISAVKIAAKNEGRAVRDGEVVPACAQSCPTRAITFGDLGDETSRVRARHHDARAYELLEETNVRPRTRYLARVKNRRREPGVS